jgi:hypothetical protein
VGRSPVDQFQFPPKPKEKKSPTSVKAFFFLNLVGVRGWTRGFAARSFGPHCVRLSELHAWVGTVRSVH